MKEILSLNFESASVEEARLFKVRNTVRAVIFDNDRNVALMHVATNDFYKLPGGGIDPGEDNLTALARECKEEAGVEIHAPVLLGLIKEIKKTDAVIQNSYCYITHMVGEKKPLKLTESEKNNGYEVLWVKLDEAINLVKSKGYLNSAGRYVVERELTILSSAKKYVTENQS